MKNISKEAFNVIGIKVQTTNQNGQAANDIPRLWEKFMSENIVEKIPNKVDQSVLAIYTNYQGDHTQPYDTIIACRVSSLETIPEGMVGQEFDEAKYVSFMAKGNLQQGAVYNAWLAIWNHDLDRTYTADFEVYDERSKDLSNAEVPIFVGVQ